MTTERPNVVGVRLSEEEYRAIVEKAEAEGLRPATYVRRMLLLYLKKEQEKFEPSEQSVD